MLIISMIYEYFVERRNVQYNSGKADIYKCAVPVISIGNICVGGSGKTPFTAMLAEGLTQRGYKPSIISRGWKRKSKGGVIVSDGQQILVKQEDAGDETYMLARKLSVPIVVHEKKEIAAKIVYENFNVDCIIVDDGFQRRSLHRDLDIVLVDRHTLDNPKLLPAGRLREPLSTLARADTVALSEDVNANEIKNYVNSNAIVIRTNTVPMKEYNLFENNGNQSIDLSKPIVAFCGIAKPERFINSLKKQNITVTDEITFRDHYSYPKRKVEGLLNKISKLGVEQLATTEKDAVKLLKYKDLFSQSGITCFVFPIQTNIIENEVQFWNKIGSIFHEKL